MTAPIETPPAGGTGLRAALQILADHQATHEGDHRLATILAAYPAEPDSASAAVPPCSNCEATTYGGCGVRSEAGQ